MGANSGAYGLAAVSAFPDADIVFVEPLERPLQNLEWNLALNGVSATVVKAALSDRDGAGTMEMPEGSDCSYSATLEVGSRQANADYQHVSVRRGASVIRDLGLASPMLCKIDVESHELQVILGFGADTLENTIFLIEVLSDEQFGLIETLLPNESFAYFGIDEAARRISPAARWLGREIKNYWIVPSQYKSIAQKLLQCV